MSETPESYKESQPKPKGNNFATLFAKAAVKTSISTLYVRHVIDTDWKSFEIDDAYELGRAGVRQLSSRIENNRDSAPLSEEDLNAFNEADYLLLVPVISKQNGWGTMPAGAGLKELGETIKAAKKKETERQKKETERHKKMLEGIRKSIDLSYGFLGNDALEKLQVQMAGLADIRSTLSRTSTIEQGIHDANLRGITSAIETTRTNEIPRIPSLHRPDETPLGRASLESAKNSREVAQKMDDLVVVVAGINQTLVQDVLPAWFKQIEEDQRSAKHTFDQAAKGLRWTKWAVIASVIVTILATWVQVEVARDIDNTEQQKQSEAILREQLAAQQKLIEQQIQDAVAMRETISVIKTPAEIVVPKK
ncbi:hypothetical protein [Nitrosomonas communis]|uniref:Uncharacterized protein n=1 Tax=Nitrosomonas communis TaxID=44574 RepID=A0A1I4LU22_9PROT|nr:hypothetical protein [Nitrosomonas communis]SFL94532.1 hypothetical protein SAMN05421863_100797 [Nitrosomonas communis]